MRDRLVEFTPLLLVGVVLLAFQLTRGSSPALLFQALPEATPTPAVTVAVGGVVAQRTPRRPTSSTNPPAVCNAAQPQFSGGMAALKAALGSSMGDPVECGRAKRLQGETQQKTQVE